MTNVVKAKLRYLKIGPKKVRLVINLIRGKKVIRAIEILSTTNKKSAKPVLKLLMSAVANAKHNHKLVLEDLRVTMIKVDEGPALSRWMPKARGRATPLKLRTSHITLELSGLEEKEITKEKKEVKKTEKKSTKETVKKIAVKKPSLKGKSTK
jgi:large subunit ribosomal protein L22